MTRSSRRGCPGLLALTCLVAIVPARSALADVPVWTESAGLTAPAIPSGPPPAAPEPGPLMPSDPRADARREGPRPGTPATQPARRALPDYDGRARPGVGATDVLLAVPRVILFPLYLLTEYAIRVPIGAVVSGLERIRFVEHAALFIKPHPNLTLGPSLVGDLGLVVSGGTFLTWDHALHQNNYFSTRGATGGLGFWLFSIADRYEFAPRSRIGARFDYLERSDWQFYGLYSNTHDYERQQFNWGRADARFYAQFGPIERLGFEVSSGLRYDMFNSLDRLTPLNQMPLAGYENKGTWYAGARGFVDSRRADRPNTTGVRLEAAMQYAVDTVRGPARRWILYEAEASAYVEIKHPGRVFGVRAYAGIVDSLGTEPVPFIDLITLGGLETMRGWFFGRFRGDSALVLTANYRYPIWYWLDGTVYIEAGNTYRGHFEGLDFRTLYGSAGLGVRTVRNRDMSFDALVAVGTSRFDEAFGVTSLRLAFGVNRGF